jgi:hypothetical protein
MKKWILAIALSCLLVSTGFAWNDKGHMVCSKLAWKELTPEERAKIVKILETHPHYQEFLKAEKPVNIPEDEWVFMRASTWSDWIRSGPPERKAYHKGEWHYINIPYIPKGDDTKAPGAGEVNVVTQVDESKKIAISGGDRIERAVRLTWVFHLVTDMHQPLHTSSVWSKQFPEGDRGGNKAKVKTETGTIQMHSFWDGLLGKEVTLNSIGQSVLEIEKGYEFHKDTLDGEMARNKTTMEWAMESHAKAVEVAYCNGELKVANEDDKVDPAMIPRAPDGYPSKCGDCARLQAAKAGKRLAGILKEIAAAN